MVNAPVLRLGVAYCADVNFKGEMIEVTKILLTQLGYTVSHDAAPDSDLGVDAGSS